MMDDDDNYDDGDDDKNDDNDDDDSVAQVHAVKTFSNQIKLLGQPYSMIADSALQRAFAATTGNFRSFSELKSIHI